MIRKKIGMRIKELRINKGMTQEELALKIDMDRSYFSSVENGNRNVSIINLYKIVTGLNIS